MRCIYTRAHTYTRLHIHTCTYICAHVHTHMDTQMCADKKIHTYAHAYINTHAYTCTHIHTHPADTQIHSGIRNTSKWQITLISTRTHHSSELPRLSYVSLWGGGTCRGPSAPTPAPRSLPASVPAQQRTRRRTSRAFKCTVNQSVEYKRCHHIK